ncbi:MAG: epoxide hydrolase family protein [Rhodanobacter sp.]
MIATPFKIAVSAEAMDELKQRLAHVRWPDAIAGSGWTYGVDLPYLRELCSYWQNQFDWRAQERSLDQLPQYRMNVNGYDIHFVHVKGKGPNPLPLLITHGWPSSFAEFGKLIPLLTDPAAHGGLAGDSFDVIAPSLPGYGFSGRPILAGTTPASTAELWLALMRALGYERFVAHGGDIGARVTHQLGRTGDDHVEAIHVMSPPYEIDTARTPLSEAERQYVSVLNEWDRDEGAYEHEQRTRPQTLSYALNDSPSGLAGWIVEKWRAWSDCNGDIESRFSKDELLTNISIYWFTQTIGSSVRMYYDSAHARQAKLFRLDTPTRLFLTREKVNLCPREWAERSYANLSYGLAARGGHFLAAEEPELLAADLRGWFRHFCS